MPFIPATHPGINAPGSSVSEKAWEVHDVWTTLRVEYVARTYCTVNLSPSTAPGPVPVIRSASSGLVGGAPGGTTSVGSLPHTPTGDGWVSGEKTMLAGFTTGAVVVVVGATVEVVVVVGGDFPENSSAPVPSTTTATMPTMMPRRVFWRRFARFCIASIFKRRAAF